MCRSLLPVFCRISVCLTIYCIAVFSTQRYIITVTLFHVLISSQTTWRSTFATICGVWIVAALFARPTALSKYTCLGSIFLWRTNHYQHFAILYLLVTCAFTLGVIAFSYIMTARHLVESSCYLSEETQIPRLKKRKFLQKLCWHLHYYFPDQLFALSDLRNVSVFRHKFGQFR
jgi:hypothetical protein